MTSVVLFTTTMTTVTTMATVTATAEECSNLLNHKVPYSPLVRQVSVHPLQRPSPLLRPNEGKKFVFQIHLFHFFVYLGLKAKSTHLIQSNSSYMKLFKRKKNETIF